MTFKVVIPARHASQRLPGKALREVAGVPLVVRVLRQARRSAADEVLVATDHPAILRAVEEDGGCALLTADTHASGTDRIAEVVRSRGWPSDTLVVNVQGDEPMLPPALIDQCAGLLADPATDVATLAHPIEDPADLHRPDVVKVVMDRAAFALYFSRASIPFVRDGGPLDDGVPPGFRHIGLYAYRAGSLLALAEATAPLMERVEKLEQLRALWLGMRIKVGIASELPGPGVDTQEDLERVSLLLQGVASS